MFVKIDVFGVNKKVQKGPAASKPFVSEELFDSSSITTMLGIEQLETSSEKEINRKRFFI